MFAVEQSTVRNSLKSALDDLAAINAALQQIESVPAQDTEALGALRGKAEQLLQELSRIAAKSGSAQYSVYQRNETNQEEVSA